MYLLKRHFVRIDPKLASDANFRQIETGLVLLDHQDTSDILLLSDFENKQINIEAFSICTKRPGHISNGG